MSIAPPTVDQFRARFAPVFDDAVAVPSTRVADAIARAGGVVDASWSDRDYQEAQMLWAANDLTLEGFGTSAAAGVFSGAGGTVKSQQAGDHKITFAVADAPSGGVSSASVYASTVYGTKFLALLRRNRGGPRVTGGFRTYSPAATDWPIPGPPGQPTIVGG